MRVIKNPEERKNEILDEAERLFLSKGYADTSVNDILEAVGIAKGTLYHYFRAKEEIMEAIVRRTAENGAKAARDVLRDESLTVFEKFIGVILVQKPSRENRRGEWMRQLHRVNNQELHCKSLTESIHLISPILTDVVNQGRDEGIMDTSSPQEAVEIILTAALFLLDAQMFQWSPEEREARVKALVTAAERVLGTEPGKLEGLADMMNEA